MRRFYWLEDGVLAGCSRPGSDPAPPVSLAEDLAELRAHGIRGVLSLTETPLEQGPLDDADLVSLHIPVPDLTAPHPEQIAQALHFIDVQRSCGRPVAVHCLQGQGRTGVILAAYLIRGGMESQEAIDHLRHICPHAVEMPEQEEALHAYMRRRDWIV